jgi:hypothetical protein
MTSGATSNDGTRVRAVMDDERPLTRRTGAPVTRGYADEEDIPLASRGGMSTASGGMPFSPPMGGAGGQQQTQSGDRERASWVYEDEDVWGTDEGGAPAVIGR